MATFQNFAKLSYNGGSTLSNLVTGEIVEALQMTKTAVSPTYAPGEDVTYVVSIVNAGTESFTGLTLTDDLGAYDIGSGTVTPLTYEAGSLLYLIDGVVQAAPAVTVGPPLVVTGITVPAEGSVQLVYTVTANEYAPLEGGTGIVNTATLAQGGLAAPVTASETVLPAGGVNLTISKFVSPETVTENGTLTYTFVIANYGAAAAEAGENLSVSDTFEPILQDIFVSIGGGTIKTDQYTYDTQTGVFVTNPGAITVPAATFVQDETGIWTITPGTVTLTVSGTV
ncbi:MAG: hypothetical protein IKO91_08410 [Oscillospiraceae bacterium]|nr:hypothetical protein [Oscillospiraceae bacterium]